MVAIVIGFVFSEVCTEKGKTVCVFSVKRQKKQHVVWQYAFN
jgi:hypothetical protein